ncbi:response regulator, partial [Escherichia coli]|uniref:response regulator n=1 Tax=Escherichia coli TaxID=562 RepID=UPI0020234CBB
MTAINRILIVDDEDNVRRMLSTAFALQGFETHCANNGRTALHLFADIHPDVVLMDIRMPEMDGIKALKEMRSHETRTPVILMTAYAEVETAVEALRCGALMNPLMILVKIIKLRWIHILSYDQMVSRKINNQTTRCANS